MHLIIKEIKGIAHKKRLIFVYPFLRYKSNTNKNKRININPGYCDEEKLLNNTTCSRLISIYGTAVIYNLVSPEAHTSYLCLRVFVVIFRVNNRDCGEAGGFKVPLSI